MLVFFYLLVFVFGAAIGSFLNVCISRLPYEKSLLWPPGSRCGHCLKPIRFFDNIPLVSYWLLGGRCRMCGGRFSVRYFMVELLTALGWVALFHLEVVENIHRLAMVDPIALRQIGWIPWQAWVYFGHHVILLSLLIVAAICDLEDREIPLGVTLFGTMVGLASSMLWAWPWPYTMAEVMPAAAANQPWWGLPVQRMPKLALYPWPIWGPLPEWLPAPGTWQLGLLTGLAGMLAGSFLLRTVRFLFNLGLGASYLESRGGDALGLGDADLMMMAGAFLGWQPIIIAFFVSVFPGVLFGMILLIVYRNAALPFGPALACGVLITWLGWSWIGPRVMPLFFHPTLMLILLVGSAVLLLLPACCCGPAAGCVAEKVDPDASVQPLATP
jgi:leader peptidase (prepilin peptidase)/N-methyltransferase